MLIKANDGMGTTKYDNVKHALAKTVENFYLYYRQPEESRIFDQSMHFHISKFFTSDFSLYISCELISCISQINST